MPQTEASFECGWCHAKLYGSDLDKNYNFAATPSEAKMGYATFTVDYDVQCHQCWCMTTIRFRIKSPLHIIDGEPENV